MKRVCSYQRRAAAAHFTSLSPLTEMTVYLFPFKTSNNAEQGPSYLFWIPYNSRHENKSYQLENWRMVEALKESPRRQIETRRQQQRLYQIEGDQPGCRPNQCIRYAHIKTSLNTLTHTSLCRIITPTVLRSFVLPSCEGIFTVNRIFCAYSLSFK